MKTHTPGPWHVDKSSSEFTRVADAKIRPIASVHTFTKHGDEVANARLIASAPDLLESLKEMAILANERISLYPVSTRDDNDRAINAMLQLRRAWAAITKATGVLS